MNRGRDGRVKYLADSLERWKEEVDHGSIPLFVQSLIATPIKDIHTLSWPQKVNPSTSLTEIIENVQGSRTAMVQCDVINESISKSVPTALLLSRMDILEHALVSPSMSAPISSLIGNLPQLGWVQEHETLDIALQRMLATGFEEVGVMDHGVFSGVLHVDDIFTFLVKDSCRLGSTYLRKVATSLKPVDTIDQESHQEVLHVESSADVRRRMAKEKSDQTMSPVRLSAQMFCKGYWTEVLLVMCIILDITCSIVVYSNGLDASNDISAQKLEVCQGTILLVFLYEAVIRIYGFRSALLRLPFEIIDLSIVTVSVVVFSLVIAGIGGSNSQILVIMARIIRGLRMFKVLRLIHEMLKKQRMMYNKDGFALDLSYITENCIAMSLPAVGSQATFANPIEEVFRFFTTKYTDRYLIYNLLTKGTYSDDVFEGRVERFMVESHNPPKFGQMVAFVESAGRFLDEDPKACIAIHCNEGKDRTGVMVAAWLMYSRFAENAEDAMKWFVTQRLGKGAKVRKGIPMASQQRYVKYMEEALKNGGYYTKRLLVKRLVIKTCPKMDAEKGSNLWFNVDEDGRPIYASSTENVVKMSQSDAEMAFELGILVSGDVRITFYNKDHDSSRDELIFFVCFHTGFVSSKEEVFVKGCVDVASTDTKCQVFMRNFAVHVCFDHIPKVDEQLPLTILQGGTALGRYHKILKASQMVTDAGIRMRGRDLRVQKQFAMKLNQKLHWKPFATKSQTVATVESNGVSADSLCCAGGPIVRHNSVELYRNGDLANGSRSRTSNSSFFTQSFGAKLARTLVSGNKRRFVEGGFDLDLSYITPRIIAMGFPSSGIESAYRNSSDEVYRFFQERHAAHYRIVNLCSERAYSLDTFHGNCVRYPFPDHNPPALELILPCCANVHKYLQADDDNVIAIHCKAGKGRTGLIVVSYLLYCGLKKSAIEARNFYDWARTSDGKGVTIISQIRYTHYFEEQLRILKAGKEPLQTAQNKAQAVVLHRLRLHTIPHFNSDASCSPSFTISVKSELDHDDYVIFKSPPTAAKGSDGASPIVIVVNSSSGSDTVDLAADDGSGIGGTRAAGDIRVTFMEESKSVVMFFFTIHSSLMTAPPAEMGGKARQLTDAECAAMALPLKTWSLVLCKHEIDRAAKDSRCAHFDPDFKVEIFFSALTGQSGTGASLEAARRRLAPESTDEVLRAGPLAEDKEGYKCYADGLSGTGVQVATFEEWLLGREAGMVNDSDGADGHDGLLGPGAGATAPAAWPDGKLDLHVKPRHAPVGLVFASLLFDKMDSPVSNC